MLTRRELGGRKGSLSLRLRWVMCLMLVLAPLAISCGQTEPTEQREGTDELHGELPAESRGPSSANATRPAEGTSGIARHEHQPRHGGVVRSVDVYHVEVVSDPLAVWLYDRRGNPLSLEDVEGQIVVYSEDERHPYRLAIERDHLASVEPMTLPPTGTAFVELSIGQNPIDVALSLPLREAPSSQATQSPDPD